ncbi:MAG: molybdenum ABC transporter ATP-binding protein [Burkholderiales bacterium]
MSLQIDVELHRGRFHLQAAFGCGSGVTALYGRSGSGKTTLINAIAGIVRPERGRIVVNGQVLFDDEQNINLATPKRRVGYVFQEGRLFPHLSVRHNLSYGQRLKPAGERYVEFNHLVELLGLENLLERRPAALSGGEKQRVAIGRALLASPRILLMDEPLASLDIQRKTEILQYIELLHLEVRIPIVYVTHAMEEVVRLADTLVLMSEGKSIAAGGVEDLMNRLDLWPLTGRYETGAVIETVVSRHDPEFDLTTLRFNGGELFVANMDALIGEKVRVRVRARDVSIALQPPAEVSILNILHGRLMEIAQREGPIVDVRIDIGGTPIIARVTQRSVRQLRLEAGQEVYAMIKAISLDRHSFGFA